MCSSALRSNCRKIALALRQVLRLSPQHACLSDHCHLLKIQNKADGKAVPVRGVDKEQQLWFLSC